MGSETLHARPPVRQLLSEDARKSAFESFFFPLKSKSMDSAALLTLPPHVRAEAGGNDHMWTLLPLLDAHSRSENKGWCEVVHVCVRGRCFTTNTALLKYYFWD